MKQNYTHIEVIIDQSGSMLGRKSDVIGSFNSFLNDQRTVNGDCTVSLTLFSNTYQPIYSMKPLKDVPDLTAGTFRPNGNTALLYSMIKVIDALGMQLSNLAEDQRPDRVVVLTLTDGEENHSYTHEPHLIELNVPNQPQPVSMLFNGANGGVLASSGNYMQIVPPPLPQPQHPPSTLQLNPAKQFDSAALLSRIKEQTDVYSWTFVYLGANHDAFTAGATMGYSMSNTLNYAATPKGFSDAFHSTSSNLKDVRTMTRAAYETKSRAFFVDADQATQDANLAATV